MLNQPTAWWLDVAHNPENLTEAQRDGHACIVCGALWTAAVPVGFATGYGQVFACDGPCGAQVRTDVARSVAQATAEPVEQPATATPMAALAAVGAYLNASDLSRDDLAHRAARVAGLLDPAINGPLDALVPRLPAILSRELGGDRG